MGESPPKLCLLFEFISMCVVEVWYCNMLISEGDGSPFNPGFLRIDSYGVAK